jgi:predicted PurR-regulated permease PerM
MNRSIDISYKTIIFTTAFFALLWVLFLIRDVIMLLFVAIIFMSALSPIVEKLEKWRIPKSLAIAAVYIVFLALVTLLISFVITPVAIQTGNLITNLPHYSSQLLPENGFIDRQTIQQQLGSISKNALEVSLTVFNNILAFISLAVLTFYLLLERQRLDDLIVQFSFGKQVKAMRIINKAEEKLGSWRRVVHQAFSSGSPSSHLNTRNSSFLDSMRTAQSTPTCVKSTQYAIAQFGKFGLAAIVSRR